MDPDQNHTEDARAASSIVFEPYRRRPQPWTQRLLSDEYLDQASCGGEALDRELGYLRAINRTFGGTALSIRAVHAASQTANRSPPADPHMKQSLADVGTGSGDIARALADAKPSLDVIGIDRRPEMIARAQVSFQGTSSRARFETGDIFTLTAQFGVQAFDFVHASLTLHHFSDERVIAALTEMSRAARRAVIWNDLKRGAAQNIAVRVATMFASISTRHDARVSVEAGFTRAEIDALAARAGLRVAWIGHSLVYRFAVVLVPASIRGASLPMDQQNITH